MTPKTVSVTDETYERLRTHKGADESFNDAINRLLDAVEGDHPLLDLVGMVDDAELKTIVERSTACRMDLENHRN